MTDKPDLDRLAATVRNAVKAAEDQKEAFEAEREAEIAMVRTVLATIAPALPLVTQKLDGYGVQGYGAAIGAVLDTRDGRIWLLSVSGGNSAFADVAGADPHVLTPLDPEDVADGWDVGEIVGALSRLLDAQIAGRGAKRNEAMRRAVKLRALAALLDD